jgi:hypothetical protein
MSPTRREFIRRVGIALASLMAARCVCPSIKGTPGSPRNRLRECWLKFDWLAERAQDWGNYEKGEQARDDLVADHRAALDDLVAAGELDTAVADYVQEAFTAAVYHVWRANCGMTCYEAMPAPDYTPFTSSQLVQQADLLAENGDLDQDTVAQAQAAIEREIAFLSLSDVETQALYDELIAAAGDTYDYPPFDELELEITPEAAEAACFLVELLLEE